MINCNSLFVWKMYFIKMNERIMEFKIDLWFEVSVKNNVFIRKELCFILYLFVFFKKGIYFFIVCIMIIMEVLYMMINDE